MTNIEMTREIDKRLLAVLPDFIYDEIKYMRKNEGENVPEEIQDFLSKDSDVDYYSLSPLIYNINKILDNLYKETPYEKYRD